MNKILFSLTALLCATAFAPAQTHTQLNTALNTAIETKTESFNATATYHVATDGVDNAANGGAANPFKTVRYALETLRSSHPEGGFELVVKNGNYGSFGYINEIEFANPVLVRAETPLQVHVKSATGNRAMYVNKSNNIIFSGFEFAGKDRPWTSPTSIVDNYYVLQIDVSKNI
ncbi:MAG: hypothetical protein LBT78_05885, partial [Tannerella sp.]|nr:hypothetical protein [Tannerella sp.]